MAAHDGEGDDDGLLKASEVQLSLEVKKLSEQVLATMMTPPVMDDNAVALAFLLLLRQQLWRPSMWSLFFVSVVPTDDN